MRKVHLISVSEPLMFDLALALKEKGYEVSASDRGLDEARRLKLEKAGCVYLGDGWFPEQLKAPIYSVVLGSTVQQDNPELLRAKELGLMVQSIPEFLFQRVRGKTRVVVAGTRGKRSILAMIMWILKRQKMAFDYALARELPPVPHLIELSYKARIALVEGDERMTSCFDKRFRLEFYRPHITVITNSIEILLELADVVAVEVGESQVERPVSELVAFVDQHRPRGRVHRVAKGEPVVKAKASNGRGCGVAKRPGLSLALVNLVSK